MHIELHRQRDMQTEIKRKTEIKRHRRTNNGKTCRMHSRKTFK